jgi:hypothetical protein
LIKNFPRLWTTGREINTVAIKMSRRQTRSTTFEDNESATHSLPPIKMKPRPAAMGRQPPNRKHTRTRNFPNDPQMDNYTESEFARYALRDMRQQQRVQEAEVKRVASHKKAR